MRGIGLLCVFLFVGLLGCTELETSAYRIKKRDSVVTKEYAEKISIDYTDSGKIRARVFSPILVAVKQIQRPYMEMNKGLKVDFYEADGDIQSYLTAEYGISYPEEKRIVVRRDVEILNVKGERLNTEELIWDQVRGRIFTDKNVTITTKDPVPICANNGPGQAPVIAQPRPKINPPYICPLLNSLVEIFISSP